MTRIIRTVDAGDWCEDCYEDAKSPHDEDFDMYKAAVLEGGRCVCCGSVVEP